MNFIKTPFALILATLTIVMVSNSAVAKVTKTIEKSFELRGKGTLALDNVNGDVDIKAWAKKSVLVKATLRAKNDDALQNIDVKMTQSDNRINVKTDYKENKNGNNNGGSVDYVVMVPKNIDLPAIELVNGGLTIEGVAGELNADLVNGSLDAFGLNSNTTVDTVNGSVKLAYADTVKNVDINVESVNGSIRLYLPSNFGAELEASTGNGVIKTDFGLTSDKGRFYGTDLDGKFGDASSNIELESVNGSIKVLKK